MYGTNHTSQTLKNLIKIFNIWDQKAKTPSKVILMCPKLTLQLIQHFNNFCF